MKKREARILHKLHNEVLEKGTYDNEKIVCHKCLCVALDNFSR